jgi:hypothetical protein
MIKIKNKKLLKHYLEKHTKNNITIKTTANHLKTTPKRFKQHYTQNKTTNTTPTIEKNLGQPQKQTTPQTIKIIKQAYQKNHLHTKYLEKIIYARQKIKISHKIIHKVLIQLKYSRHQHNKQKRRKP